MNPTRKPPFPEVAGVNLVRFHAQGGTSEIWYGEHKITGSPRAVKVLLPEFCETEGASDAERDRLDRVKTRFIREGEALMEYPYPQVVRGYGLGREVTTKRLCTIMEFLEGEDLQELVDGKGRLEVHVALRIFDQVAETVARMHDDGRLHRDLKCGNAILVGSDPETFVVKLIDLGLVSHPDGISARKSKITDELGLDFTTEFAPLEQILQKPDCFHDKRIDVYALGVILYHLLTGKFPRPEWPTDRRFSLQESKAMRTAFEQACRQPEPLRQLAPGVPQDLADLVHRCIEFDPEQRFASARHLCNALGPIRRRYWLRCVCGCDVRQGRNRCPRCATRLTDEGVLVIQGPPRLVTQPLRLAWALHIGLLVAALPAVGILAGMADPVAAIGAAFGNFALPSNPLVWFLVAGGIGVWWLIAWYWIVAPTRSGTAHDAPSTSEPEASRRPTPPPRPTPQPANAPLPPAQLKPQPKTNPKPTPKPRATPSPSPTPRPTPRPRPTPHQTPRPSSLFPDDGGGPFLECHDGEIIPIIGPVLRLGRANAVVAELRDPGLGGVHTVIHAQGGAPLAIEDMGEPAGTFLNGKKLKPRTRLPLQSGDRVTVGMSVEFVVRN